MVMMMVTTKRGTITPAMTGVLSLSVGNGVVAPSVVGVAEYGTGIVSSVVAMLDGGTVVVSPVLDVSDVVAGIMEAVVEGYCIRVPA